MAIKWNWSATTAACKAVGQFDQGGAATHLLKFADTRLH
jgi:hypothetical protein